jgi:hypothetical protein
MTEHTCPWCGGEEFVELGQLGSRLHLRCRGCGADSSIVEEVEEFLTAVSRHPSAQL